MSLKESENFGISFLGNEAINLSATPLEILVSEKNLTLSILELVD